MLCLSVLCALQKKTYVYIPTSPFYHWWIFGLFSVWGYPEECCRTIFILLVYTWVCISVGYITYRIWDIWICEPKYFPKRLYQLTLTSGGCSACLLITYFGHAEMNVLNIPYSFNLHFPEDWTPFHVYVGHVIAFSWGNWISCAFFSCLFSFWKQAVLQLPSPILELVFSFY